MTILLNRPTATEATRESASRESRTAVRRPKGSYTTRYDRPQADARPEGSYVSVAGTRTRGSYTCTDGAAVRTRPEGSYTLRG